MFSPVTVLYYRDCWGARVVSGGAKHRAKTVIQEVVANKVRLMLRFVAVTTHIATPVCYLAGDGSRRLRPRLKKATLRHAYEHLSFDYG